MPLFNLNFKKSQEKKSPTADAISAHKIIVILLKVLGPLQNHWHWSLSAAGDSLVIL